MPGKTSAKGLRRAIVRLPAKDIERVDAIVTKATKVTGKDITQAAVMRHIVEMGLLAVERGQAFGEIGRYLVSRGRLLGQKAKKAKPVVVDLEETLPG